MTYIILGLDSLVAASALLSSWYWFLASEHRVRRVSRREQLDAADINRLVTALNRTQVLNSRAALSTALAAIIATFRMLLNILN